MSEEKTEFSFDSFDLISFLLKKIKALIVIAVLAAIISAFVSYTITPKYKSTVVLYPAPLNSISKTLFTDFISDKVIGKIGEEEDVERMLQILYSDEIRNKIVEKYNLKKHYGIGGSSKNPEADLINTFYENISFSKTRYTSIEINVLDRNPKLAANIANSISDILDETVNNIQRKRAVEKFKIVENEYLVMKKTIVMLKDSMQVLSKLGINDYTSQSERFNEAYAKAIIEGKEKAVKKMEEKIKILSEYGAAYISIYNQYTFEHERYAFLKRKYREAKVEVEQNLPVKYIISKAFPADKKSYPIRWLIVALSVFGALAFSIVTLILIEKVKKS